MKYETKAIETYHSLMILSCVLMFLGGTFIAYAFSQEVYSYTYVYGTYTETNWVTFFAYFIATIILTAIDYAVCQVTCEFFNNVHCIAKQVKERSLQESTSSASALQDIESNLPEM